MYKYSCKLEGNYLNKNIYTELRFLCSDKPVLITWIYMHNSSLKKKKNNSLNYEHTYTQPSKNRLESASINNKETPTHSSASAERNKMENEPIKMFACGCAWVLPVLSNYPAATAAVINASSMTSRESQQSPLHTVRRSCTRAASCIFSRFPQSTKVCRFILNSFSQPESVSEVAAPDWVVTVL